MSFGWSAGDILTACVFIKAVIKSLDDAEGASAQYKTLIKELWGIERAFMQVHDFCQSRDDYTEQRVALMTCTRHCKTEIDQFLARINRLHPLLSGNVRRRNVGAVLKSSIAKINWSLCKSSQIDEFRDQLKCHTATIDLLLNALQAQIAHVESRRNDSRFTTLFSRLQAGYARLMIAFGVVNKHTTDLLQHSERILQTLQEVVSHHVKIFQAVLEVQQMLRMGLPGQVERQQPITLIDALGHYSPFHLEFIRSLDALKAVLKSNFRGIEGSSAKIDQDGFIIEDKIAKRDLNLQNDWYTVFHPGQTVYMSMIYRPDESMDGSCPHCHHQSQNQTSQEVTCPKCTTVYQTFVEYVEIASSDPRTFVWPIWTWNSAELNRGRRLISTIEKNRGFTEHRSPYLRLRVLKCDFRSKFDATIYDPLTRLDQLVTESVEQDTKSPLRAPIVTRHEVNKWRDYLSLENASHEQVLSQ